MQLQRDDFLALQVAMGWILLLLIKTVGFSAAILFSIYAENGFRELFSDPGPTSARSLWYVFWLISAMPIYIMVATRSRQVWLRWISVPIAAAFLLIGILHELSHWQYGDRPDFNSHVIDLMNHGAALWILVNSIRWARSGNHSVQAA